MGLLDSNLLECEQVRRRACVGGQAQRIAALGLHRPARVRLLPERRAPALAVGHHMRPVLVQLCRRR